MALAAILPAGSTHHLIGENAIDAVVVQVDEPVEALKLVVAHLAELDARRLHGQPVLPLCRLWAIRAKAQSSPLGVPK